MEKFIKGIPYILFCFIFCGALVIGYNFISEKNNYNSSSFYFNCNDLSVDVGESKRLDAGYNFYGGKGDISFQSSDTSVLTIDGNMIYGVMPGKVTLTATFSNYDVKKTCDVIVEDNIDKLSLSASNVFLVPGGSYTIYANIPNENLVWTSSSDIVTVSNGYVLAHGYGVAIVTATSIDGQSASVEISVSANTSTNSQPEVPVVPDNSVVTPDVDITPVTPNTDTIKVNSVQLNTNSLTMEIGDTASLVATVLPSNATNKSVTWSSSNKKVATVMNGIVTATGIGKATITVKSVDGDKKATVSIVVKEKVIPVSNVSLNNSNISMSIGNSKTLKATVSPSNATNKTITWTSSNTNIATVKDGEVIAKSNGAVIITATSTNGKSASCTVVIGKPTLSISKTEMSIIDEKTRKLTTSLSYDILDQGVTWSSSNTSIATVDSNGNVKANAVGTATITAKSNYDSSITVSCKVTVRAARVLFIGNSKTYYPGAVNDDNGIPKRFKAIAKNRGYEIEYTQAVIGGVALNKILEDSTQSSKIKKKYDYVIVNEGTDRAYNNKDAYYNDINTIKEWTTAKNANVDIYVRKFWLRIKKDSNGNPDGGSTVAQIRKSYENAEEIANKLGLYTTNDGPLFYDMMDNSSIHIMKYQDGVTTDLTHQNATGAYLAALCFYAEVYNNDPTQVTYNAGISSSTAATLKSYAKKHCYNN